MCQGLQSRFQIHPNLCQIPLFRNYFKLIEQLVSHLNLLHIHLKLIQIHSQFQSLLSLIQIQNSMKNSLIIPHCKKLIDFLSKAM